MVQASGKEAQIWGSSTDDSQPPPPPLTRMEPNPAGLGHPPTSSAPSSQTDLSEIDDSLSPLPSQSITVNPSPSPPCPSPTTTTASTPTKPVPPRRSPPKKRRGGGLAAAALKMKNKGKKMSTLEKVRPFTFPTPPNLSCFGVKTPRLTRQNPLPTFSQRAVIHGLARSPIGRAHRGRTPPAGSEPPRGRRRVPREAGISDQGGRLQRSLKGGEEGINRLKARHPSLLFSRYLYFSEFISL